MTDAELRGRLLKHFYNLRDKNGGRVPVSDIILAPDLVSREAIANACQHLADAGLVQWELFTPVLEQHALGRAKITGPGIDVVTGSRSSTLDVRFPDQPPASPITTTIKESERIDRAEGLPGMLRPSGETTNAVLPAPRELITLKPALWGMSIDLKELTRRVIAWWKATL